MSALIEPFVALCLFRLTPQQLPNSTLLLGIVLLANAIIGCIGLTIHQLSFASALAGGLLDSALIAGLGASLLLMARQSNRMVQTLTALAGSGAVLSALAIPLHATYSSMAANGDAGTLPSLLILGIFAWLIGVYGNILRHALGVHLMVGTLLAFVMYYVSNLVFIELLPVPAATG